MEKPNFVEPEDLVLKEDSYDFEDLFENLEFSKQSSNRRTKHLKKKKARRKMKKLSQRKNRKKK